MVNVILLKQARIFLKGLLKMNILHQHLSSIPQALVDSLLSEYQKIHEQYFLGRWEPSQLNGGRFAESILRIIEYKCNTHFTPIGVQLNRRSIIDVAERNTILPDSLRFQIPRIASLMLDFRNNRNVGHLGRIEVNRMDSTFVLQAANWIVAELIRLETHMDPAAAEVEMHKIIERKVPIIEETGGRLKILDPSMDTREKILVICYQKFPNSTSETDLLDWVEYDTHNKGRFRSYLKELNDDRRIDYRNGNIVLTKRGVLWVEKNIIFALEI
jgi:hypothetical protein